MSTTLLFVELLIIGMQTAAWLILLLLTVFGFSWLKLPDISGWDNILLLIFLAFSYVLGVMIDRLSDSIFDPWNKSLQKKFFSDSPIYVGVVRFEIAKGNEYLNRQFEYTRSRIRIVRSTAVNLFLLTITGVIAVAVRGQNMITNVRWGIIVAISLLGLALFLLSLFSFQKLMYTYLNMVKRNYEKMAKNDEVESETENSMPAKLWSEGPSLTPPPLVG